MAKRDTVASTARGVQCRAESVMGPGLRFSFRSTTPLLITVAFRAPFLVETSVSGLRVMLSAAPIAVKAHRSTGRVNVSRQLIPRTVCINRRQGDLPNESGVVYELSTVPLILGQSIDGFSDLGRVIDRDTSSNLRDLDMGSVLL